MSGRYFESQGQRLVKDGKTLPSAVENISELTAMAQELRRQTSAGAQGAGCGPRGWGSYGTGRSRYR